MGDKTGIQWTDATWNFIRGCGRKSPGCENCYAEVVANRFSGPGQPFEGLITLGQKGPRWNNKIKLVPEKMDQPLRWTRKRMIFVNSVSDLFHKNVPFEFIAASFGVMAEANKHIFQILTKRPERAKVFFGWLTAEATSRGTTMVDVCLDEAAKVTKRKKLSGPQPAWPLSNVWLGVSAENQATADDRIPKLLMLPAAVSWVSYEPALGPVNFYGWLGSQPAKSGSNIGSTIDWIVVGGESGSNARKFHWKWAEDVVMQCKNSTTKVFVKQMGTNPDMTGANVPPLTSRKGGDMAEWPTTIQVREYPR